MKNTNKYIKPYFMPPEVDMSWTQKTEIDKAPIWCSVDLRDGNQALIEPMSLDEKLAYFQMLVDLGFKEIEVGFPAASETEYAFIRKLIDDELIPEDVTIQVLTQARPHIIKKTFEAINGAHKAIVHLYNSTSKAQREQVFQKDREEIKNLAIEGAQLLKDLAKDEPGNIRFEYSPESFHGTEVDYAAEVCNAVLDVWQPTEDRKAIINIPSTVENAMPHIFASQVAYMNNHLDHRDNVVLSVHPHNDRGCGVATSEVSILAGADRLEGTLFGNGERTGNADIVTVAMNMFSHGFDPELDFSNMPIIVEKYEDFTGMKVSPRQPYAGELVFTAFSGSHQDAISKGLDHYDKSEEKIWDVPYLPIDPRDVGRSYDKDIIRINSQSGKGGVAYILKQNYGMTLPKQMREDISYAVKDVSDVEHRELSPEWVYEIFNSRYINRRDAFSIPEAHFEQKDGITAHVTIRQDGKDQVVTAKGNGRINAVNNAIKDFLGLDYELSVYEEHALTKGSMAKASAYIGIKSKDGNIFWGVGIDEDIIKASIEALVSAVNNLILNQENQNKDQRLEAILKYVRANADNVTLETLAEEFNLSIPYLSRYIKEKSGKGFSDILTEIRMQRACSLLRGSSIPIAQVSEKVGYQNVEHFTRQFKKIYGCTPSEYRNG